MEKIKFYKYYFKGVAKPIIMEAESKAVADNMLEQLGINSQTKIDLKLLEDVRIEMPIVGVSVKKRKGLDYVWVGKDNSSDGWMLKDDFAEIERQNSKKH
jgi:hypothetical protein